VRGLAMPLLAGAHVIAKTASSEGAFARAFHAALTQADAAIGARLAVLQFSREDEEATRALCTGVDALSVYGSDETVAQLRRLCDTQARTPSAAAVNDDASGSRVPSDSHTEATIPAVGVEAERAAPNAAASSHHSGVSPARPAARSDREELEANSRRPRVIAHGHGLSAAYVTRSALSSPEQAARTAERVALDISAYDQHGCLSPHFVLVEPGGAIEPQAFAQLLAASALPTLAQLLPAADPTLQEQAERMQWQATAAVRGELHVHPTHAVSFEEAPLRPSPGGRQIGVYTCADAAELLAPFAAHLKCIGVAGSRAERAALTENVQHFCSAQVCRSGEMQCPPFDAWADGAPPLAGLFREPTR
jgi:hypothetical protein